MTLLLLNVLLALAWVALTGSVSPANFVIGFVLGYAALWMTRSRDGQTVYFNKARNAIGFGFFFLWEIVKANLRVAYEVLTPRHHMTPGIIAFPLEAKTDAEITILANLITLTPGTLSLSVWALAIRMLAVVASDPVFRKMLISEDGTISFSFLASRF